MELSTAVTVRIRGSVVTEADFGKKMERAILLALIARARSPLAARDDLNDFKPVLASVASIALRRLHY